MPAAAVPLAMAGGSLLSGAVGAYGAKKASDAQVDASRYAADTQRQMYDQTRNDQAPYRQAGNNALAAMQGGFGMGPASGGIASGQFNHMFDANDLKNGLAPNYDFQLQQGLGATNNQNSVTGGLVGGNALKGINDYAQGYAGNAYQQAFNNYNTGQSNIFNRLASLAGEGQTSNGQTAQAGMAYGGNIGSAQLAGGAASAAGTMGMTNAITGAMNNAAGSYYANDLMKGWRS